MRCSGKWCPRRNGVQAFYCIRYRFQHANVNESSALGFVFVGVLVGGLKRASVVQAYDRPFMRGRGW